MVAHYDVLLIATGSRSFIPPIEGAFNPDRSLRSGVFGFRTLDDCSAIVAAGTAKPVRRGDRRWAAGPGGGHADCSITAAMCMSCISVLH